MRIRELALSRPRFGYLRIHVLLNRDGWKVNRKRVHRLYRLEGLQVRMRVRRRKRLSLHRGPAPRPTALGERWSMDFVHDQLANGSAFRVLTVVDNWSRESVVLETGFRLTGETVAMALGRIAVRGCFRDYARAYRSRAATAIVDDELLAEAGRQLAEEDPRKRVGAAARRERHDHSHRLHWIALCMCNAGSAHAERDQHS
jgi:transposase InsO family protein